MQYKKNTIISQEPEVTSYCSSKNLRKTWQILSNAIRKPKTKKDSCSVLNVDGSAITEGCSAITDPSVMAESFNNFFATGAVNVVSKINPSKKSPTEKISYNENVFSLKNSPVTVSEILEATKLLQDKKNS